MATFAIPSMAVTYHGLLSCVLRASTGLSKPGVGVEPLFCLIFWGHARVCARGGGVMSMQLWTLSLAACPVPLLVNAPWPIQYCVHPAAPDPLEIC